MIKKYFCCFKDFQYKKFNESDDKKIEITIYPFKYDDKKTENTIYPFKNLQKEEEEEEITKIDYTSYMPDVLIKRANENKIAKMIYFTDLERFESELNSFNLDFIEKNEYKIPYLVFNSCYKKTIIISNGRFSILSLFEIIKKLSSDLKIRIILYQHPGYHLSKPDEPSQNKWDRALEIIVNHFKKSSSEIGIIGLSIGCSAVCNYLIKNPDPAIKISFCSLVKSLPEMVSKNPVLKQKLIQHLYETSDKLELIDNYVKIYYSKNDEFTPEEIRNDLFSKIKNRSETKIKGGHYCFNKIENIKMIITEMFV